MKRPLLLSFLFHTTVLVLALIALPVFNPDPPELEQSIVVELANVAEISNPPPQPVARVEPAPEPEPPKPKAPDPAPPPKVEAPAPAPAPKPEPQVAEPKPTPEPAPPPEPAPEPALAEVPEPRPKQVAEKVESPEKQEAIRPKNRPKPPTENKSADKPAETKKEESDFTSVLKTVEELKRRAKTPETTPEADADTPSPVAPGSSLEEQIALALRQNSGREHDPSLAVTMSEIDAVRRQIGRCWNLPAGAKGAQDLIVAIRVEMKIDGTPMSARIDQKGTTGSNPFYQAAAESALRAVLNPRCHPFHLPPEKYQRWRTMTLVFDPKEMFGT